MSITNDEIEKIESLAIDVMNLSRNTLVVNLRFMDSAISRLQLLPGGIDYAVDGEHIMYNPLHVLKQYRKAKEKTTRAYAHMIFHCIFRHFDVQTLLEINCWNLACDIAVEAVINELNVKSLTTPEAESKERAIEALREEIGLVTAEKLYRHFLDGNVSPEKMEKLAKLFTVDDHSIWYATPEILQAAADTQSDENSSVGLNESDESQNNGRAELSRMWKDVSEQMQMDLESFSKQQGDMAGSMMMNLKEVNREKYDYTSFLKKFAVMGEAMKINDDEFDYIFYTYGLNQYGKMPLIEPLEYKEVKRIKEFVIAIDTSGSVYGETVQNFLQKTYNILSQQENFFTKINLHIIQCDADIQEDVKVTSKEEFDYYLENITLKGFGGTDFRPVFDYVDEMIKNREFTNLKGLIYFTDGWGEFPMRQPAYNSAFVFIDDDYNNYDVPVWAIKLVLSTEEINEH